MSSQSNRNHGEYWAVKKEGLAMAEQIPDSIELYPVRDGYGWYGVLSCTQEGDKVRCHLCGRWYTGLGNHAEHAHGMTADEYKGEFELGNIGLVAPEYSNRQRQHAIDTDLRGKINNLQSFKTGHVQGERSLRAHLLTTSRYKSDEMREAASAAQYRRWTDPDKKQEGKKHLDNIRADAVKRSKTVLTNKPKSPEHREKLLQYARNRPDSHREAIRNYARNRSEKHRQALLRVAIQRKQERETAVLDALSKNNGATTEVLCKLTNTSRQHILTMLKELEGKGKVRREVETRPRKYYVFYLVKDRP